MENIGVFKQGPHAVEHDICYMFEKQSNQITIYSRYYGTLLRFNPIGKLKIIIYPLYKTAFQKRGVTVIDDESWHLVDYIKWIIEGAGCELKEFKYITFKELRDKILVGVI